MMKKNKLAILALLISISILAALAVPAWAGGKYRGRQNDQVEIEHLLKAYAWAVDHKDTELWMSIWNSNAVYDLSNLGFGTVEGLEALENFMNCLVFPGEPMSFSFISNINIKFTGKNKAIGTDYFIHEGYVPVELNSDGTIVKKFSQFFPDTWYLVEALLDVGTNPLSKSNYAYDFVRDHKEGQHQYEFVKKHGKWKISYLKGLPLYSGTEVVKAMYNAQIGGMAIPIDQRPNEAFYENWLDSACTKCMLFGPCTP